MGGDALLAPGSELGGYRVERVAGRGAMAVTYAARRLADGREVALKVPRSRVLADPTAALRFLQEANLGRRLSSPFIARVYDSGEHAGTPYLAMELLAGMTLREALDATAPLARRRALQITRDIAAALEHAHQAGVVHRDLKPANIMLHERRPLKVMDFGIAKILGDAGITSSQVFLGSPSYAAPEMGDPAPIDHRVDLYALGIMLYEMLQGAVPFTARSAVEVLMAHRTRPLPTPAELSHPVHAADWRLITSLTHKDRDRRLPDARSVRLAVELLLR